MRELELGNTTLHSPSFGESHLSGCKISDCNNFIDRPLPQFCDCSDQDKMQMCGECIGQGHPDKAKQECPPLSHIAPLPYGEELLMCAPDGMQVDGTGGAADDPDKKAKKVMVGVVVGFVQLLLIAAGSAIV